MTLYLHIHIVSSSCLTSADITLTQRVWHRWFSVVGQPLWWGQDCDCRVDWCRKDRCQTMSNWQPSTAFTVCYQYEVKMSREMQPLKAEIWSVFELNEHCFVCDEWMTYIRCNTTGWCLEHFFTYWECHNPNWRTHIFQRGRLKPPTRRRSVWWMFYSVKQVTEPPLKLWISWFWGTPKRLIKEKQTRREEEGSYQVLGLLADIYI